MQNRWRWIRTNRWRVLAALAVVPLTLAITRGFAGAEMDKARQLAFSSPVRSMAFWQYDPESSLESRVQVPPQELLRYLAAANIVQGYPGVPKAVDITPELRHDFDQAIGEMPEQLRHLVAARLIGIFIVKDLGSTGLTDMVEMSGARPTSGMVIIDVSVFEHRAANIWASWKENSPFTANPQFSLSAVIEDPSHDDRVHAIQYILLHEFGHVVSIGRDLTPPWNRPPPADHELRAFRFAPLSWRVADNGQGYVSTFEQVLPMRSKLHFYTGASIDAAQMPLVFEDLAATNFATLYGATNVGDDFAEALANYTHVVMMHRPYAIEIRKDGQVTETYRACWDEARCQKKRAILEAVLAPAAK